jgi:hypothetical protein
MFRRVAELQDVDGGLGLELDVAAPVHLTVVGLRVVRRRVLRDSPGREKNVKNIVKSRYVLLISPLCSFSYQCNPV